MVRVPEIIRVALKRVLEDQQATAEEIDMAESLLDKLMQMQEQTKPRRKLRKSEIAALSSESSIDQLWKTIEDRHFDQLYDIAMKGIQTETQRLVAIACTGLVKSEINLRINRRLLDEINETTQ